MIKYLLAERIKNVLAVNLNDGYVIRDPEYVNAIEAFQYRSNPMADGSRVIVYGDNPEELNFRDSRVDAKQPQEFDLGLNLPSGEIGGGHYWWRRGTVKVDFYGIGKKSQPTREDAAKVAYNILGRVHNCLDSIQVADLVDEWGERAFVLYATSSYYKESGGQTQNIWRGLVYWQCLTHRVV